MPPADSRDFLRAARQRLTTAEALLDLKFNLDAQYIGGYTVECALKALILYSTPDADRPDTLQRISSGAVMHRPGLAESGSLSAAEHLDVDQLPAGRGVEAKQSKRNAALFHGRRHPHLAARHHRRGPAQAGHLGLPRDVGRLVPLDGEILFAGVALSIRATERRPVLSRQHRRRATDDTDDADDAGQDSCHGAAGFRLPATAANRLTSQRGRAARGPKRREPGWRRR